ncbi:MAG: preprotein translocase subunit SecG [Ferruginibacter sp.]|nr:preprotein translocase subunit SecG [Ferruginibacter sp.]
MLVLFGILIIVASAILGIIVLIQNPKGGGLSASLGGFSNQLMGVKQTTDVLEKGTWLFAAIVGILCIVSPAFIPKDSGNSKNKELLENVKPETQKAAPASNTVPMPGTTTPDTPAKK